MTEKEYYIEKYNKRWNECLEETSKSESNDHGYDATILFDETANAEEVVGYYLVNHMKNPLRDWLNNIEGIKLNEQDKEITRILKRLETRVYKAFRMEEIICLESKKQKNICKI